MLMKFKPVFNFQSVEFEYEVTTTEELTDAFRWYEAILKGLQEVAVDQPGPVKAQPKEAMASDKQVVTLKKLGVDEKEAKKMTSKQAYLKIKELIGD